MALRFVQPSTKRLDLSDNEWIEIKQELTIGERKASETAGMTRLVADTDDATKSAIQLDWRKFGIERALAYLVNWSAKHPVTGDAIPLTRDTLSSLDTASFEEIENAISAYLKERDAAKKLSGTPGTPASSAN